MSGGGLSAGRNQALSVNPVRDPGHHQTERLGRPGMGAAVAATGIAFGGGGGI